MNEKPTTGAGKNPPGPAQTKSGRPSPAGGKGRPATSTTGEEDPGAALDDPAMRDAMSGEASESEQKVAERLRREQGSATAGGTTDRKG